MIAASMEDLAAEYHLRCRAFDNANCTGPNRNWSRQPANAWQQRESDRNSMEVLASLKERADAIGADLADLLQAIRRDFG